MAVTSFKGAAHAVAGDGLVWNIGSCTSVQLHFRCVLLNGRKEGLSTNKCHAQIFTNPADLPVEQPIKLNCDQISAFDLQAAFADISIALNS